MSYVLPRARGGRDTSPCTPPRSSACWCRRCTGWAADRCTRPGTPANTAHPGHPENRKWSIISRSSLLEKLCLLEKLPCLLEKLPCLLEKVTMSAGKVTVSAGKVTMSAGKLSCLLESYHVCWKGSDTFAISQLQTQITPKNKFKLKLYFSNLSPSP